ncbi:hypothetical protein IEZ26_12970 [Nocardioides cavernae]|uniref:Uncharacterized protein n=1 Tax=Nocardioides cavernae TaxID=1921566 RepID=A0ABR8NBM7_9ACTN|nr:hypothetical protein [Nocardioides cavernae]MBD3925541.1 hypothetical protein [Nocardioides cavernae]MBM7514079.1 hypothetical protein [Nocardioides cavernae]
MGAPESSRDTRFTTLPAGVRAEDMVAGVDAGSSPEPDDVRNVDQHAATRDD